MEWQDNGENKVWLRLRLFCFEREKDERDVYRYSWRSRLYWAWCD
jgi:hypothetical protein